jgi:TRAP-type transport system periplasmic protein
MSKKINTLLKYATIAAAMSVSISSHVIAAESVSLKVVGTWGNLNNWKKVEQPFWSEVTTNSKGKMSVDAKSMTDVGLKGFEVMKMVQLGVFDVGHGIISYLSEDPVAEGIDLAGVTRDWGTAKKVVAAYEDLLAERFEKTYNTKLLSIYPFPSQVMLCNKPINNINDLKGKKVRSYSRSMADLLTGLGATGVTLPFAEVVPALQLGTVDCGITGSLPSFVSKWHEVTTNIYQLPVGYSFTFLAMNNKKWNSLSDEDRAFLTTEVKRFTSNAWAVAEDDDTQGISCLAGEATCKLENPGKLIKVMVSDADKPILKNALENSVLKNYGERCGKECSDNWNKTIGVVTGLQIPQ